MPENASFYCPQAHNQNDREMKLQLHCFFHRFSAMRPAHPREYRSSSCARLVDADLCKLDLYAVKSEGWVLFCDTSATNDNALMNATILQHSIRNFPNYMQFLGHTRWVRGGGNVSPKGEMSTKGGSKGGGKVHPAGEN